MPNAPKTPHRQVRVDDDIWTRLGQAAEAAGTDRSAVIRALVAWWLREPGARLPRRPDAADPAGHPTVPAAPSSVRPDEIVKFEHGRH